MIFSGGKKMTIHLWATATTKNLMHVTLYEILNIVGIDAGLLTKTTTHGLVKYYTCLLCFCGTMERFTSGSIDLGGQPHLGDGCRTSRFCHWISPMPATHSRNVEASGNSIVAV